MATDLTAPVYSTLGNDPDLQDLVALFVDEMPGRIEKLIARFDAGELDELRRAAHQLKGAAGSYGFHAVTPLAARLEANLRGDALEDQIQADLDSLIALCGRMRAGSAV